MSPIGPFRCLAIERSIIDEPGVKFVSGFCLFLYNISTRSASYSIDPLSRRSDNKGFGSTRPSIVRLNCDNAIIGT